MKRLFVSAAVVAALSGNASAAILYSNDFDGNLVVGTGVSVAGLTNGALDPGNTFGDWTGSYFRNNSAGNPALMSTLTLSNLAPHTQVSASFILGFLESWDSRDGGCCSPDNLDFYIDDVKVASLTARNALGTIEDFGGGSVTAHFVQANGNFFYSDTLVDMSSAPFLNFAHTGATLKLGIQASGAGWQGGDDEAWGIDKVAITYDGRPVPEPSTWGMMVVGALLAGATLRRRVAANKG